jgi:hypothetical protein
MVPKQCGEATRAPCTLLPLMRHLAPMLWVRRPAPIKLESNWYPYARGVCLRGEHKHVSLFSDIGYTQLLVEALFVWQVLRHLKGFLDDLPSSLRSHALTGLVPRRDAVHCSLIWFSMGKGERGDGDHTLRLIQYLAVITLSSIQVRPRHYGAPADRPTAALSALPTTLVCGGAQDRQRAASRPNPHVR